MSQHFLHELNPKQRLAVENIDKSVIVIAGPGTGKTKTLTAKIAYCLQNHISPQKILAVTFTRKSAKEMRQRLKQLVGRKRLPQVTTFHGFCYGYLLEEDSALQLIDETDRKKIIEDILQQTKVKVSMKEVSDYISHKKNWLTITSDPKLEQCFDLYQQQLGALDKKDFDDLQVLTEEKLRTTNEQHFTHLFIDEFQDTNPIQYSLFRLLLSPATYFTVIGDPLQSIYKFRGADATIFDQLRKDSKDVKTITLTQNYRSCPEIIFSAQRLFPDSPTLTAANKNAGEVKIITTLNTFSEADWIVNDIVQKVGGSDLLNSTADTVVGKSISFQDFAIIYRTHAMRRAIEKRLFQSGLPYQIIGQSSVYEKPWMQLIIEAVQFFADPEIQLTKWKEASDWLQSKSQDFQKMPFTDCIHQLVEYIQDHFSETWEQDSPREYQQLQSQWLHFSELQQPIQRFLQYIDRMKEAEYYDSQAERITLLTIHGAKGLEFRFVYICNFVDGAIPYVRKDTTAEDLAEERRLLYVALTRAKHGVYLLTSQEKTDRSPLIVSRFYSDLNNSYLQEEIDPQLEQLQKKRYKSDLKKRQMKMF